MFVPFTTTTRLPVKGDVETYVLDFKRAADRQKQGGAYDYTELAKDIAMFANAGGGTILYGASEIGSTKTLDCYLWLDAVMAANLRTAVEQAVRDKCRPAPVFDVVNMANPSNPSELAVAVNVHPLPGAVVGVQLDANRGSYFFPYRVGTHCRPLSPEILPMMMLPALRRTITLLRNIAPADYVETKGSNVPAFDMIVHVTVSEEENVMSFASPSRHLQRFRYPLDRIVSVWKGDKGWHITLLPA